MAETLNKITDELRKAMLKECQQSSYDIVTNTKSNYLNWIGQTVWARQINPDCAVIFSNGESLGIYHRTAGIWGMVRGSLCIIDPLKLDPAVKKWVDQVFLLIETWPSLYDC